LIGRIGRISFFLFDDYAKKEKEKEKKTNFCGSKLFYQAMVWRPFLTFSFLLI
jgi:hypothetical protein